MPKTDKPATKKKHAVKTSISIGIQGRHLLSDEDLVKVLGDDFRNEFLQDEPNS